MTTSRRRLDGADEANVAALSPRSQTTVWVSPSATSFSCLCEACLEAARNEGLLFAEALMLASVRGTIEPDAEVSARRCSAGHSLVLRRIEKPPALSRPDDRQLALS